MAAKTKENKGDNILVIKLQEHKTPEFKEVKGKEYITIGAKNDYPEYLLKLYDRSGKHNAIINQKSYYIFGGGSDEGDKLIINEEGETLDDIARKIILDHELFGGFALEVTWTLGGKKAELRHVNFSHIRSNEDNSKFFFTKGWVRYYYDENGNCITLPVANPEQNKDWQIWDTYDPKNRKGQQLYYYKCYRPGADTYPLPEYIGAIPFIEIDFEIANFWLNSVKNGFTSSHIVTFYGDAGTVEEQKKLEERIKKKFTGTDNGGRIILNFSQNKEKGGSEIANITPQDLDKQFQVLNETIQQEIFTGHRITSPMLLGIKTPGQLGGRNELMVANELLQNVVIAPKQQLFNKLLTKLSGEVLGNKKEITLKKIIPIGMDLIDSTNGWQMLNEDEKRQYIGYEPFQKTQTQEGNELITALNMLAPRVADSVLAAMEKNEIRSILGLPPVDTPAQPVQPIPPGAQGNNAKFASMKNPPIDIFKKYKGAPRKGILIASRELHWEDTLDLKAKEHAFSRQNFAQLRSKQLSVLDLLVKDPLMPPDRISEALRKSGMDISTEEVNNIITFLKKRDLLEESKQKSGDGIEAISVQVLTPVRDAIKILEATPAPTENIFTVYSYEFRSPFTEEEDGDNMRDWCAKLFEESKQREAAGNLWTREEIELMQNDFGMSVWESRGGWSTVKGTDIHKPYCHHIWFQHIYSVEA